MPETRFYCHCNTFLKIVCGNLSGVRPRSAPLPLHARYRDRGGRPGQEELVRGAQPSPRAPTTIATTTTVTATRPRRPMDSSPGGALVSRCQSIKITSLDATEALCILYVPVHIYFSECSTQLLTAWCDKVCARAFFYSARQCDIFLSRRNRRKIYFSRLYVYYTFLIPFEPGSVTTGIHALVSSDVWYAIKK